MNSKFQISNVKVLLVAVLGIALSSCSLIGGGETPEYRVADLQGLWLENNTEHYVRFTSEQSDEVGYLLGREWDEADWDDPDMTAEEYLIWNREQLGHPGNGWFKYKLETKGDLTEIHLMDNEGGEIPKSYVVSKLTSTELQYYEKDRKTNKFYFSKVVTTK